jgi:hypothetical protein
MAMKKIRIDFSKVEERSGWNTRQIPEGLHKMKIESVQATEAGDGTDMLVYALKPVDGRYKSRLFPFYCKLQQNQYWKLRDLLVAAGQKVPKSVANIDPSNIVGKYIAAEVEDESNQQYAGRSVVNGTYGLDILDDNSDASEPDDYDEEEGPEDEEADEEENELDTLSLPELRKLAKSLGITTTGLKQDDLIEAIEEAQSEDEDEDEDEDDLFEDDLEDDELEDEEFEDDEEEEEPAPARRRPAAKSAPAKGAPARRKVARR